MAQAGKIPVRLHPYPTPVIESITPEQAKKYLTTMVANRPLNARRTIEYALAMDDQEWILNGETIKFNHKGNMIDGQHRMEACILAGKPFRSWVIRGIDEEKAFSTIDQGARTHADIFGLAGIKSAAVHSAAAHVLYYYKKGMLKTISGPRSLTANTRVRKMIKGTKFSKAGGLNGAEHITKEDLLEFQRPYETALADAIHKIEGTGIKKVMSLSLAVALYVLFTEQAPGKAYDFFEQLAKGTNLTQRHPVYVLREKLIENRSAVEKMDRWAVMLLVIKAWNAYRNNESVRYYKLLENEQFPKIK